MPRFLLWATRWPVITFTRMGTQRQSSFKAEADKFRFRVEFKVYKGHPDRNSKPPYLFPFQFLTRVLPPQGTELSVSQPVSALHTTGYLEYY